MSPLLDVSPLVQATIMMAPLLFVVVMIGWLVAVPTRKRWPHLGWFGRLTTIITFDERRQDRIAGDITPPPRAPKAASGPHSPGNEAS